MIPADEIAKSYPRVPNLPLLRKILDHIDAHPREWYQARWATNWADHMADLAVTWGKDSPVYAGRVAQLQDSFGTSEFCGTTYCIAGWAVHHTEGISWNKDGLGYPDGAFKGRSWQQAGQFALGLTNYEAESLFFAAHTREQVQDVAERIAARAGETL